MSTVSSFLLTVGYVLGAVWELLRYALRFGWVLLLPKVVLAARLPAAESQLATELNRSGGSWRRRRRFAPGVRRSSGEALYSPLLAPSGHVERL